MMSPLISTVILLCYFSLAEGNIAVTVDNGDTIVCKLKKQMPVVEFWNEYENETLASCYESSCYVHTDYSGQFTISCNVSQQTFYLKIENMPIYLEKKFYCKDGENSGFVIFNNKETKVDELEESQKHDVTAVIVVIAVLAVVAVVAVVAYMFCGRKKKGIYDSRKGDGDKGATVMSFLHIGKVSEPNLEEQGDGNLMNNTVHKDSMDDISTVKKEITKTMKAVSPRTGTSIVKQLDGSEEEECVELLSTFIPEFKNAPLNLPEPHRLPNTGLLNWPMEEQNNKVCLSSSVSDRKKPCSEVWDQKIERKEGQIFSSGSGFQIASCSSQGKDEDCDLNVEDDDSEKCCTFQYSEDDVIPWASDEPDWDRVREALIETFFSTADAPTCLKSHSRLTSTVCHKRVSGTPKELKEHVELCLKRRDGELDAVDVKAEEQFQEYTWAGQTRRRASSMLDGGYAVCNKRVSGTPEEFKEHVGAYNPEDSVTSSREKCEPNDDIVYGEETGGSAGQIITTLRCPLKEKNEQTGPKCFICVEQYNKPMGSSQCGHVHCEECWLRTMRAKKKLCPQCNMITSPADLHRIYL